MTNATVNHQVPTWEEVIKDAVKVAQAMRVTRHLDLGCTLARHQQIGIDAVVNARAGIKHLNSISLEDIELRRDVWKIRDHAEKRIAIHQFNSKFARRHMDRLAHLISA